MATRGQRHRAKVIHKNISLLLETCTHAHARGYERLRDNEEREKAKTEGLRCVLSQRCPCTCAHGDVQKQIEVQAKRARRKKSLGGDRVERVDKKL